MNAHQNLKPDVPSGYMELLPEEQMEFDRLKGIIVKHYELHGFLRLETPCVERLSILMAKANEEDKKLIFGVDTLIDGNFKRKIPKVALPFDLTVPLARYVAQHCGGEIDFPFRRYQIDRVHRGERKQAGRFREFYQADIDVIGMGDLPLLHDAEMPAVIHGIFQEIGVAKYVIRINNRKIHNGLFTHLNVPDTYVGQREDSDGNVRKVTCSCLSIIDLLPKKGGEWVANEFRTAVGLRDETVAQIMDFLAIEGTKDEVIARLRSLQFNELFDLGVNELDEVLGSMHSLGVPDDVYRIDLTITRGLNYYTGTVYETTLHGHESLGSVCSGGRFDDLAGLFCKQKLPGVGISIGLTRLFDHLLRHGALQVGRKSPVEVIVFNMDASLRGDYFSLAAALRAAGISTEVYLADRKIDRQTKYAVKKRIPYGVFMDAARHSKNVCSIRNYETGQEEEVAIAELPQWLHQHESLTT